MIGPFWKTIALGVVASSVLYFVCFAEPSSAELIDPFTVGGTNSELVHYSSKKQVAGAYKVQSTEAL